MDRINKHMSIVARLALLAGVAIVVIVFTTYLLATRALNDISFSQKERAGSGYIEQVWDAIGGASLDGHAEHDAQFGSAEETEALLAAQNPDARWERGAALIVAVADGSNLTLDPDLDSFYAMDAAAFKIPSLLLAGRALERAVLSAQTEGDVGVAVAAAQFDVAVSAAIGSLNAAMDNNAAGDTRRALEQSTQALETAAAELSGARNAGAVSAAQQSFAQAGDVAWRTSLAELNRLLEQRIATKQSGLTFELSLVALGLMLTCALVWIVSSGLGRRFAQLATAMDQIGAGDERTDIPCLDDTNETGKIAATLQVLKESLARDRALQSERAEAERALEAERRQAEAERAARAAEQSTVVSVLADGLHNLSAGDLSKPIAKAFAPEYEALRIDFNAAVGKLAEAMQVIAGNAGAIRTGAGEISHAADDLSRRTEQQAAALEETAAALDEITATVRKTADGARQADAVVTAARADAQASGEVVNAAVSAMSEIEKSARQITTIIGVIDEIAFQTNLLALNAGVEAARAGDAGRGFAVVAMEVRALAQRSSDAAKEIKSLISVSEGHVEQGVGLVGKTGAALSGIVAKVAEISELVREISASAQEQATGLVEVNTAINQMDQVTQQNAAMVEQSTAASHSLAQEASELAVLVAKFKLGADARDARARAA